MKISYEVKLYFPMITGILLLPIEISVDFLTTERGKQYTLKYESVQTII